VTTQNTDHPAPQFPCPLCRTPSPAYYSDEYYRCPACEGIFRNPGRLLSPDAEKARYERHQNNPDDPGYRTFVSPLVTAITNHLPPGSQGLDFGAGPGPVVSAMLREQDYRTDLYDPFFHPDRRPLEQTWDFVFCCEVIEHFYHPAHEFARLYSLLRPGAPLFCMTNIHTDDIDFPSWYYKDDETHTFIYREKTLHTIARLIGFTTCTINGRVVRFDTPAPAGTVAGAGAMDPARALSPAKALNPAKTLNPGEIAPITKAESPAGVANPGAIPRAEGPDVRP